MTRVDIYSPYLNVQPQFAGIRIVENNGMTSGSYLIGDFSKAKFWMRKGMDFKKSMIRTKTINTQLKTITLYMRGTLVAKDADKLAFVTDTFADSITGNHQETPNRPVKYPALIHFKRYEKVYFYRDFWTDYNVQSSSNTWSCY